jgi:hypothetical protein
MIVMLNYFYNLKNSKFLSDMRINFFCLWLLFVLALIELIDPYFRNDFTHLNRSAGN